MNMRLIAIFPLLLALIFPSLIFAETNDIEFEEKVTEMTLTESLALMLRKNRSVKSSYLNRVLQLWSLKVAEDEFSPDLTIDVSNQFSSNNVNNQRTNTVTGGVKASLRQKFITGTTASFVWNNGVSVDGNSLSSKAYDSAWSLNLSQPLLRGSGIDINTAPLVTSRVNEKINVLNLKSTLIDQVTSTIIDFRSLLKSQKQFEISQQSLKRSRDLYEVNKALVKAGRMAKVDIIQTEADIANQEFNQISNLNSLENQRLTFLRSLDMERHKMIRPVEKMDVEYIPLDYLNNLGIAMNNRTDYQIALLSQQVAELGVTLAENNSLYNLDLTGSLGSSGTGNNLSNAVKQSGNINDSNYSVGLKLSIPFGDLTRKQGIVNAKVSLEQQRINLIELRENIEIEVKNGIRDIEKTYKQIMLARQATKLSELKLEIEGIKYKAGRSSNFAMVTYQNDLVTAKNNELFSKIDYLNALTKFDKILGTTLETWGINPNDLHQAILEKYE